VLSTVTTPTADEAASWYAGREGAAFYARFEARYVATARDLFIELALDRCRRPPRRILDVGAGTGGGLARLRERVPGAELVGIDPSAEMLELAARKLGDAAWLVRTAVEELPQDLGGFDLVLSHSNLRLWSDPVAGLRRIGDALRPGGMAYVLDLRADMRPALRARLLRQLGNGVTRRFLESQLGVAYSTREVSRLVAAAGLDHADVRAGGMGGRPLMSNATYELLERSEEISLVLNRLSRVGFGAPDMCLHLFIDAKEDACSSRRTRSSSIAA
jgi:ubiquinone/menaquinone biosynthesis C-methylase UbiE